MTNRELLKEAIADAKAVKEVAITNAKAALEEAFTPQIKSMFEKQIMEMEEKEEKRHSMEEKMHDEKKHDETVEEELDEDLELEALLRELEEAEEEEEESEEEESEEEEKEDEKEEMDLDFDEMEKNPEKFADLIEKIVDEVIDEMIADGELEAGHEGMENEPGAMGPVEAPEEAPAEEMPLAESLDEIEMGPVDLVQAALITLGSLGGIIGAGFAKASQEEKKEAAKKLAQAMEKVKEGSETEKELEEAYAALEAVKTELNEVNLLNSKLLYVNKIFKAKNLTEAQKVHVLAAFDKAETVKESKLIYETLSESLAKVSASTKKKEFVNESKSFASKSVGTSPKQPVVEVNPVFERMKKLAGLK